MLTPVSGVEENQENIFFERRPAQPPEQREGFGDVERGMSQAATKLVEAPGAAARQVGCPNRH